MQAVEVLQKRGGMSIEGASTKGRIWLSDADVCGGSFDVKQYIVLLAAREGYVLEMSNIQGNSCVS